MNPEEKRAGRARFAAVLRAAVLVLLAACGAACRRAVASRAEAPPPPAPPAARSAPAPLPSAYGFRTEERRAVEAFLADNPRLRLPAESDRRVSASGEGDVRHLYGVYHPYFVRGDVNDDGVLDFVMAFVRNERGSSTPWFTVVVFTGRERSPARIEFGSGTFLERDVSLAAGDLSIDRDAVLITPDLEDETTRRYRWDPARRSYVFVRDDVPEVERPDFSQT